MGGGANERLFCALAEAFDLCLVLQIQPLASSLRMADRNPIARCRSVVVVPRSDSRNANPGMLSGRAKKSGAHVIKPLHVYIFVLNVPDGCRSGSKGTRPSVLCGALSDVFDQLLLSQYNWKRTVTELDTRTNSC